MQYKLLSGYPKVDQLNSRIWLKMHSCLRKWYLLTVSEEPARIGKAQD